MTAADLVTGLNAFRPEGDREFSVLVRVGEQDYRAVCGMARGPLVIVLVTRPLEADETPPP